MTLDSNSIFVTWKTLIVYCYVFLYTGIGERKCLSAVRHRDPHGAPIMKEKELREKGWREGRQARKLAFTGRQTFFDHVQNTKLSVAPKCI